MNITYPSEAKYRRLYAHDVEYMVVLELVSSVDGLDGLGEKEGSRSNVPASPTSFLFFFSKVLSSGHCSGRERGCPVVPDVAEFCHLSATKSRLYIWTALQVCRMLHDHIQDSASAHRAFYR